MDYEVSDIFQLELPRNVDELVGARRSDVGVTISRKVGSNSSAHIALDMRRWSTGKGPLFRTLRFQALGHVVVWQAPSAL